MQLTAREPVKPSCAVRARLYVAFAPLFMVAEVDDPLDASMLTVAPVPANCTVCGLSGASSVIVSVPFCAPVAEGSKKTLTVQEAPGTNELLQAFAIPNGLAVATD